MIKILAIILMFLVAGCVGDKPSSSNSYITATNNNTNSYKVPSVMNVIPKTTVNLQSFVDDFPNATHFQIVSGKNFSVSLSKDEAVFNNTLRVSDPSSGGNIKLIAIKNKIVIGSKIVK